MDDRLNTDATKRRYSVVDALIDGPVAEKAPASRPVPAPVEQPASAPVEGIQSINSIQSIHKTRRGRSADRGEAIRDTSKAGCKEGETRFSFIIREEYEEQIKALAYWDRKDIKELMDEIISDYMEKKKVKEGLDEAMASYQRRKKR
jgi:hypothetical protein